MKNAAPNLVAESSDWTGTYTWQLKNWTKLTEKKIYSPSFEIGGYTWRLLVLPSGIDIQRTSDFIAVYLSFPEASFTPQGMCPKVKFEIVAVNSDCPEESLRREATHTFSTQAADWGFAQFISIDSMQSWNSGFLVNDTFTLSANVLVEIDGILGMTSKFETGFVGIRSFGTSSLLSSFLQCLFHIKAIRKAVFQLSTRTSDNPKNSLPLALQHLFYKLQYHSKSAEIVDRMCMLDWVVSSSPLGLDVLKIQRLLFEKVCEGNKARSLEDCISKLLLGGYSNYNESPTISEAPIKKQSFMDIPLETLECKDIYASLEKFCHIDTLEDDSHRTNHRVVESKQYVLFDSFPTILQFQLKRCYCNSERNAILKVNSHYEFYDELDLDYNDGMLLSKNADKTVENRYKLHSAIVHADSPKQGRYFAFIHCDEKWYKFDGEIVKEVSSEEAIDAQFGDRDGQVSANFSKGFKISNKSAAVMLVYIRTSDWKTVMCEADDKCLPMEIRACFEKKRIAKEQRKKEKQEAHQYVAIKLACERHFCDQLGKSYYFDVANFDDVKKYRIHKRTPFEDFKEIVANDFGIPKHLQRFWQWTRRTNNTMRVSKPLIEGEVDLNTVLDLRHYKDKNSPPYQEKTALMTIKLFLETPDEAALTGGITGGTLRPIKSGELLIFFKLFDPESRKLSYLGHMFIQKSCPFQIVFENAKRLAGISVKEEVIGFEEVKYLPAVICTELVPEGTPEKSQLIQGDIIVIQKVARNSNNEFPTVKSFLEFIQNITKVNFKPLKNPEDEGFKLNLLKTMTYEQVTIELAKYLEVEDPKKLRLTQHNIYAHMPHRSPIKYNGIESLEQMILHARQNTNLLYYEVLDIQLPYLETLKCLTIGFHNAKGEWQSEHQLRFSKDKKVSDLVKALKVELGREYINCDMRIMEILCSKVFKVLDPESCLEQLYESYWIFRAEVIPEDQKNLKSDEFLVIFCHCKPDDHYTTVFGDPLWVKVKRGETVREVKVKVQKTLEIADEEFNEWKFAYHSRPMHPLDYLKEEDEILAKFSRLAISGRTNGKFVGDNTSFIALVHEDTRPGRPSQSYDRYYSSERSV